MNISSSSVTDIALVIATIFISMSVHEAMHAFTSHWLGDPTAKDLGRITLNPLKHIDPFATLLLPVITLILFHVPLLAAKPVPFDPTRVKFEEFGAALVGIAGPVSNFILAAIVAGILHLVGNDLSAAVIHGLLVFMSINISLFVFNMIPLPPLDGSRLLYAFAPEAVQEVMASLERYGIMLIFILILAIPAFTNILISVNQSLLRFLL